MAVEALLPHQEISLKDWITPNQLLLGGIGTGKSTCLAQSALYALATWANIRILCVANTYTQLFNATVPAITAILDKHNIPYLLVTSGARKRIEVYGSVIFLYSLEKYDNIRGIEVGLILGDESCFSDPQARQVIKGRNRHPIGPRIIKEFSSPNGFNHYYDLFVNPKKPDKYKLIKAKTKDNIFLHINSPGYYEELVESYGGEDTPLALQELFGEFVALQEGAIYNGFKREKNIRPCQLDKRFPVFVGADFNIEKMSATYIQYIGGIFYICREVQLTHANANTLDLGNRILQDLKGYQVYIVPDSTGKNRHSSATSTLTDHQVLKELGFNILPTHNPFIRDRQLTLNYYFHKSQCFIDPGCKETIKEFETLNNRDKEGKVAHLSVTAGYVSSKLAPLKTHNQSSFF